MTRVDMHCHSTASQESRLGVQRAVGLPECATPPREVYELAKRRGMDFVTITDHDTIDGVLEIADRPDVFISEELTAFFRGQPQAVHILCYGLTPEDHEWLQVHNGDVEECAEYLHTNDIYIATCEGVGIGGSDDHAGVDRRLAAVAEIDVPFYPGLRIGVPSLSVAVETLAEGRFDAIHVCSPGPVGIAGALVARGLRLPLIGSYHTELTAYAALRSQDAGVANAMRVAVRCFYDACDLVLSPSPASDEALARLGVSGERIARWDRGVDTTRFDPALRGGPTPPGWPTPPFGQVILEAQASGLPVVAVAAGGPLSLIRNDIDGLLCAPSAEALAAAVVKLAGSPALRGRLAAAGLGAVRGRTWENALARLAGGYRQALAGSDVYDNNTRGQLHAA
jgi:glycosyltransferase involved in cell wall biosynthesis